MADDPIAAALVLAAGRGERLGHALPKAFVSLRGVSLLERSIRALAAVHRIGRILPVVAASEFGRYAELGLTGRDLSRSRRSGVILQDAVPGGVLRQHSVLAGLRALPSDVTWVAVHDSARCLVTPEEIESVLDAARETGAAILARPATDTIKRVRDGFVVESPPRGECFAAQTPQVFTRKILEEAVEKAVADGVVGTDDAQLVARLGVRVRVVVGSASNLKITEPGDLVAAESWLDALSESGGAAKGRAR